MKAELPYVYGTRQRAGACFGPGSLPFDRLGVQNTFLRLAAANSCLYQLVTIDCTIVCKEKAPSNSDGF